MSLRRLLLVSLTTIGLLALPGVASSASASADQTATPLAKAPGKAVAKTSAKDVTAPWPTWIDFWPTIDKSRVYGTDTVIQGWLMTDHGEAGTGSYQGTLTLERRFNGTSTWAQIRTTHTYLVEIPNTDPVKYEARWRFTVPTIKNATYRVNFAGDDLNGGHQPTHGDIKINAFRKISLSLNKNTLAVWGKVAPSFTGKRIAIERKDCASCTYKKVRSIKVKAGSKYRTNLNAPVHGKWWFRLSTPADEKFLKTNTGTIVTRRVAR